ncbi:MAG: metallophosphoesterase [Actinomycetaceae bacterium]|nr:metallophosphoesterase [Actinomycetaceae bacterium]
MAAYHDGGLTYRGRGPTYRGLARASARAAATTLATGFAAGALAGTWSLVEAKAYTLRRRTVLLDGTGVSAGARLRILHISDVHLVARQRSKLRWIEGLAQLRPDLIVSTGDMIAHPSALAPLLSALSPLSGTPGAFVFGSNDYYYPKLKNPLRYFSRDTSPDGRELDERQQLPWPEMAVAFEQAGWLNLNNTRGRLSVGEWELDFVGVDDPHLGRDAFPPARAWQAPDPQAAGGAQVEGHGGFAPVAGSGEAHGREAGSGGLRIGVAHAPYARVLDTMVDDGCSLIFAGHTHGGQICVPGKGALVTNCDMPTRLAAGMFEWPDPGEVIRYDGAAPQSRQRHAWVNVSAGLGTSPFSPIRLACRPEATVLDVVAV